MSPPTSASATTVRGWSTSSPNSSLSSAIHARSTACESSTRSRPCKRRPLRGGHLGDDGFAVLGADPDLDRAAARGTNDGECAAVERRALRQAEGLLGAGIRRAERAKYTGPADLDGYESVTVGGKDGVVVLQRDGDVGEVAVVGADGVAVTGRGELQRPVGRP